MSVIRELNAMEILDSRGRPTVLCRMRLEGGPWVAASVPSGASTGKAEAHELRDGDKGRYGGLGCRKAVTSIEEEVANALVGAPIADQQQLDRKLIELDGTGDKSLLGANALLAVSITFARAQAIERGVPLYQHFGDVAGLPLRSLPRLTINLFSGGKHAGGQVPIQDVLLVPRAATIDVGLAEVYAVYQAAAELCRRKYEARALVADEGGLAPPFASAHEMLADAVAAIRAAGLEPGRDVALAIDVASSHFYRDARYHLDAGSPGLDSAHMIGQVASWVDEFPIVSVEDALAEDDWAHWPTLCQTICPRALILGDDFLCTNPQRIARAIKERAANALLLKVNQIGTLSEAAESLRLARSAGWRVTISARSGETEDNWLADLAVGWGGDQIKIGSITRSERLAKYNRLLQIEHNTELPVNPWPAL